MTGPSSTHKLREGQARSDEEQKLANGTCEASEHLQSKMIGFQTYGAETGGRGNEDQKTDAVLKQQNLQRRNSSGGFTQGAHQGRAEECERDERNSQREILSGGLCFQVHGYLRV